VWKFWPILSLWNPDAYSANEPNTGAGVKQHESNVKKIVLDGQIERGDAFIAETHAMLTSCPRSSRRRAPANAAAYRVQQWLVASSRRVAQCYMQWQF
jgi:hypothetical protein